MTKRQSRLRRFAPLIALGLAAVATITCAHALIGASKFDWPAWVQAVGSIEAILVAVWVSADQANQQRERDEANERSVVMGMLHSLRAEIEFSLKHAGTEIAANLAQTEAGQPFLFRIVLPEYPFPIFDALIPRLGMIRESQLQRQIIHAFASAKSFAMTLNQHNELVIAYAVAERRHLEEQTHATATYLAVASTELSMYSDTLREIFEPTRTQLRALLSALTAFLDA